MTEVQVLLKRLLEDRTAYESELLRGKVEDFAGYQRLVGVIQGLTRAEIHVKDLVQRLENFDE